MTAAKTPTVRSILVNRRGDEPLIIENIPSTARITFGPVTPGKQNYGDNPNALRIYTTANNQLAVILNVTDFRDLSLDVKMRKTTKKIREDAQRGPDGEYRKSDYEETHEWVEVNN